MNDIMVFKVAGNEIRTMIKDGVAWFVAKDICEAFGDTHYLRTLFRVEEDDKGYDTFGTPGGPQKMVTVNEAGLYTILFLLQPQDKASMPKGKYEERVAMIKEYRRWVTHDVLPAIRQHGAYVAKPASQLEVIQMAVSEMMKQEKRIELLEERTQGIKDIVATVTDHWRDDVNSMLKLAGMRAGGGDKYREIRQQSYDLLEERAGADLDIRLRNKRLRMMEKGAPDSEIDKANYLDVIEPDKRLREIYTAIVKELSIKYVA